MINFLTRLLSLLLFSWLSWTSANLQASDLSASDQEALQKLIASLNYQSGIIPLGQGLATVNLPENLHYLSPSDAVKVLTQLWGNPPTDKPPLGMIVSEHDLRWGVIITYQEDGYVKDSDAEKIDYTDLLKKMQKSTTEENAERTKQGFTPIELVGWAVPPRYDQTAKTLYWAQELKFGGEPKNTLNYNMRILGRKGVLVLNAVAGMDQLQQVQGNAPQLLQAVTYTPGNRYADFNHSTDQVATYGIAALVAGGVAAKLGFFKLLWVGILASYKFILIGLAATGRYIAKLFKKKEKPSTPVENQT